ncbi:hypothetical protein EDB89DRAFT_1906275 [Lactarius sanguifluus]|nr:hypothetical protein EDB89DRAFT_1906275 [Lactarius sanguifluus]
MSFDGDKDGDVNDDEDAIESQKRKITSFVVHFLGLCAFGVIILNPYLYPSKPVPVVAGTGNPCIRVRVQTGEATDRGFDGYPYPHAPYYCLWLLKSCGLLVTVVIAMCSPHAITVAVAVVAASWSPRRHRHLHRLVVIVHHSRPVAVIVIVAVALPHGHLSPHRLPVIATVPLSLLLPLWCRIVTAVVSSWVNRGEIMDDKRERDGWMDRMGWDGMKVREVYLQCLHCRVPWGGAAGLDSSPGWVVTTARQLCDPVVMRKNGQMGETCTGKLQLEENRWRGATSWEWVRFGGSTVPKILKGGVRAQGLCYPSSYIVAAKVEQKLKTRGYLCCGYGFCTGWEITTLTRTRVTRTCDPYGFCRPVTIPSSVRGSAKRSKELN